MRPANPRAASAPQPRNTPTAPKVTQAARQFPSKPAGPAQGVAQPKTLTTKPPVANTPARPTRPRTSPFKPSRPGVIQALFSVGHATTYIEKIVSDEEWPKNKPDSLWNWFRTKRNAISTRDSDPRWSGDVPGQVQSQANIESALETKWTLIAYERRIAAEKAAREKAWEDAQAAVTPKLRKHIFVGDYVVGTDIPSGYHSKAGVSGTHEAYGTKTPIEAFPGVYQQSVKAKGGTRKKKPIQSTFFPDTIGGRATTMNDVIFAVGTGMASDSKTVKYPEEWRGMRLRKIGETWFPDGGSDDLLAE